MSKETSSESSEKLLANRKKKGITRREFIAGTIGGVVVGAAAGAVACSLGFPKTVATTTTQTQTATATQTQTATATTTQVAVQAPPPITITINGIPTYLTVGTDATDVSPSETLAYTLRERLGLTETKQACKEGDCGSCTVFADGRTILSCLTLTAECDGRSITTIEGLANPTTGALHPIQQAFVNTLGSLQCGYCTPGTITSAKALLDQNPNATEDDVRLAISGNVCRCTGYLGIVAAILAAAKSLGGS